VERRDASTVAPQALWMLNNPFVLGVADGLAARLVRERPGDSPEVAAARVERAWRLLYGRPPEPDESAAALALVEAGGPGGWPDLTHVLLCTTEFVHVD